MSTNIFQLASSSVPSVPSAEETVNTVNNWWNNPETQAWLFQRPIYIGLIILFALLAHWILVRAINKLANHNMKEGRKKTAERQAESKHSHEVPEPDPEKMHQIRLMEKSRENRRKSRIKTLSGVAKSAVAIFVWVWAVIAILDVVGINVGPLIASAGIVGVALGFGAQSLVQDFLSGIFMLIEDQYGIGDVVDLGDGTMGEIEEISLRITSLRDIDGALWHVRNGEILKVANHSSDWSIARFQIPVSHSNDQNKVWKVLTEAMAKAAADERCANEIMEAPEIQGASEFNPDYLSYRVSVITMPGEQWHVMRVMNGLIMNELAEAGIKTPYPHGIGIAGPGGEPLGRAQQ